MIEFDPQTNVAETAAQRLAEMLEWTAAMIATECWHNGKPDPAGLKVAQDILTALKQEANSHDT